MCLPFKILIGTLAAARVGEIANNCKDSRVFPNANFITCLIPYPKRDQLIQIRIKRVRYLVFTAPTQPWAIQQATI